MSSPRRRLGAKWTLQQQEGKASTAPHTCALSLGPRSHPLPAAMGCNVTHPGLCLSTGTPQRKNSVRRILELRSCQIFYLLAIPKHITFCKVSEKACRQGSLPFTNFDTGSVFKYNTVSKEASCLTHTLLPQNEPYWIGIPKYFHTTIQ